ncbi:ABC-2 type transport system permease protein [Anaerotaenia torta]|uniref:ABC transporter permease n=1 Tax=Anaerotaenia torta TaxID=433293 RepID=UPI003D1DC4DF
MKQSLFTGAGHLLRFMLRRDRIRLVVWVLAISLFTILMAPYFTDTYPTAESRQMMAASMEGPAMVLLFGPVYSPDNYTNGAMFSNFLLLFMGAIVAVMNIRTIARHTRQDEELGRMEVIRSLPTGKLANMTAAILLSVIANVAMTLLISVGIPLFGIEDLGGAGSFNFAAALGVIGIFFAITTSLFCQLFSSNRTALSVSFSFAAATYLLRGIGDGGIRALTVTSPFGMMHMTEAFVRNLWWPLVLLLGISVLLTAVAFSLGKMRDLGAGLIPARPGRKNAATLLSNSLGLSVRLLRGSVAAWALIVLVLCAVFGSLFGDLETLVGESEILASYFSHADFTIVEEFLTLLTVLIAMVSTVPAVSFLMKLRGEEKEGHAEHIISRSVSRNALLAGYFAIALVVSAALTVIGMLSLWGIASVTIEEVPTLAVFFQASLHYIPAIWTLIGLSTALVGIFPKATGVAFGYLGYCFFAMFTVMMFGMPEWIGTLSPYSYIPQIPLENANLGTAGILVATAAVLSIVGFVGYRKRDAMFY